MTSVRAWITAAVAAVALGALADTAPAEPTSATAGAVSFNETFVRGLHTELDLDDPIAVFRHVFSQLPDEVTVYPTENYYYWSLTAQGRAIWGNLRLDAVDRDRGIIHLGYFEYDETGRLADRRHWYRELSADDDVRVEKRDRFVYTVSHADRTVTFRLNDVGMTPPVKAALRPDERFIGPVFDESGVRFHLIFNTAINGFMYLLDEDVAPPETYREIGNRISIGRRTGFAYYADTENRRKILIAVDALNVRRNNYYDGPFDQLPDNYVEQTRIAEYLVRGGIAAGDRIDAFGHLLDEPGHRVTIVSYREYSAERDLTFVRSCRRTRHARPAFYACITAQH